MNLLFMLCILDHEEKIIVTGRGSQSQDVDIEQPTHLVRKGWDKCFFRAITFFSTGRYVMPTSINGSERLNSGSYKVHAAIFTEMDEEFLSNVYTVSFIQTKDLEV